MRRLAVGLAVLGLLVSGSGGIVSAQYAGPQSAQTPAPSAPLSISDCSTAQLSDVIAVYLATPAPKASPPPIPPTANAYLAHVLRGRLDACVARLGGAAKPRALACKYSSADKGDARALYTQLRFCVTLVSSVPPAPAVVPWQIPGTSGVQNEHVIFVLGVGPEADSAMVYKLVSTMTTYLNDGKTYTGYYFADDSTLIPEPSWTTQDFAMQCEGSPNVEGAIIVQVTAAGNGASDNFVSRRSWTAIEATALYAQCTHITPTSSGIPAFVWISQMEGQDGHSTTVTPLMPLSLLLLAVAGYEEFAPARTTSNVTTRAFPNPTSPTPSPGTGRVTQIQTTNQTTENASSLGTVAGTFLGSAITYTNSAVPLAQSPAVDQLTWNTLQSLAIRLMTDMNCWRPAPPPAGTLYATDIIGAPQSLPSYSPPAGLGAYQTGVPSAPFCGPPRLNESVHNILPSTPRP